MSLLSRLITLHRPAASAPPPPPAPAGSSADPDRPLGCGWFDSSHELSRGLQITVHAEDTGRLPGVPLSWWLAWELDAALTSVR